jgi:hypothetical protein
MRKKEEKVFPLGRFSIPSFEMYIPNFGMHISNFATYIPNFEMEKSFRERNIFHVKKIKY